MTQSRERIWLAGEIIELPKGFTAIEPCGQGAYGFVFIAEKSTQEKSEFVAIKKMSGVLSKETTAKRFLRELIVLRHLNHDNILSIAEIIVPVSGNSPDVYVVYEKMETDLGSVIKSKQKFSSLQLQLIFYQLMRGLKYVHSADIIHRDIKPRNLLINANCDLKIADFGLVRLASGNPAMTDYVCTRWYRAPEMLYMSPSYGTKVDVFSAGCVLAEMVALKPLLPGANSENQLEITMRRTGLVKNEDMDNVPPGYYKSFIHTINARVKPGGDLVKYLEGNNGAREGSSLLNLLRNLLQFNPQNRSTATDALKHEFFGTLSMEEDEPICVSNELRSDWDAYSDIADLNKLRDRISEQSRTLRPILTT